MLPKRKPKQTPPSSEKTNTDSITDILQKQVEEERKKFKTIEVNESTQNSGKKVIYKKRTVQADTTKANEEILRSNKKYSNSEVSAETQAESFQHTPEPTGFTYFDRLNEKDIFLDPLTNF